MKKATTICLIIALCLVLIGTAIFLVVMARHHWDFAALSKGDYETNTYTVSEDFQSISLDTETEDIVFLLSEGESCRVEIVERKKEPHKVYVKNGTLNIEQTEAESWLDSISFFSFESTKITVWLPKAEFEALSIRESTGDVQIPTDFSFGKIDIDASTGDIDCRASVSGALRIETSTGDIRLEKLRAETIKLTVSTGRVEARDVDCRENLEISVSTGRTELTDLSCGSFRSNGSTGSLVMKNVTVAGTLQAERSTGSVRLEDCDAAELNIITDTGDVTGSLRSPKVFITQSDTGSIHVPESVTGGKCKVSTDTGDIQFDIQAN